ncbi:inositol-pentakisphosphate 2-kinase [Neocloeon triangulifer]|uniref:inositol-pentakisphosphate 2-kinase n=1 Tax=Neocloeon triangulifer TaxID=2078957 RepID=UPI00286F78D8|nr:inositol-pentakisphosphate 2-kinase [Neocloeon triangulifer]
MTAPRGLVQRASSNLLEQPRRAPPFTIGARRAAEGSIIMLNGVAAAENENSVPRLNLSNVKWKYRGEGNANLVIALPNERCIVRLRKVDKCKLVRHSEADRYSEAQRLRQEVAFYHKVMIPLLGSCFLKQSVVYRLDKEQVQKISQILQNQRPAHRNHKDVFCAADLVAVYPDYTLLPESLTDQVGGTSTFCVEIKPKQGWIHPEDRIMPKCTYCMKQYLKLKNKSISRLSDYCPLDLYSGNKQRMKDAIQALLVSPQNNLKIFKDGYLIYGEGEKTNLLDVLRCWFGPKNKLAEHQVLLETFCNLVIESLCREIPDSSTLERLRSALLSEEKREANGSPRDSLCRQVNSLWQPVCDWNRQPLPPNCILGRILAVQMLEVPRSQVDLKVHDAFPFLDGDEYLTPVQRYLLAATAKDCSVLLSFQQTSQERVDILPPRHVIHETISQQSFVFNIGVSDLDPKPLSCIEKHRKRDLEMLMAMLELTSCNKQPAKRDID